MTLSLSRLLLCPTTRNGAPAIHGGAASVLKPSPSVPFVPTRPAVLRRCRRPAFPRFGSFSRGTFGTYFTVYYGYHSWVAFSLPFLVFLGFFSKNEHRFPGVFFIESLGRSHSDRRALLIHSGIWQLSCQTLFVFPISDSFRIRT